MPVPVQIGLGVFVVYLLCCKAYWDTVALEPARYQKWRDRGWREGWDQGFDDGVLFAKAFATLNEIIADCEATPPAEQPESLPGAQRATRKRPTHTSAKPSVKK
jgi:hypothetical protein